MKIRIFFWGFPTLVIATVTTIGVFGDFRISTGHLGTKVYDLSFDSFRLRIRVASEKEIEGRKLAFDDPAKLKEHERIKTFSNLGKRNFNVSSKRLKVSFSYTKNHKIFGN